MWLLDVALPGPAEELGAQLGLPVVYAELECDPEILHIWGG
jgi:hypothetical protein